MKELGLLNNDIKKIIKQLKVNEDGEFSSHEFIQNFTQSFQRQYVEMLSKYKDSGHAFQSLHGQIAKHLSENSNYFEIEKRGKDTSVNIFGDKVKVEWWAKTTKEME